MQFGNYPKGEGLISGEKPLAAIREDRERREGEREGARRFSAFLRRVSAANSTSGPPSIHSPSSGSDASCRFDLLDHSTHLHSIVRHPRGCPYSQCLRQRRYHLNAFRSSPSSSFRPRHPSRRGQTVASSSLPTFNNTRVTSSGRSRTSETGSSDPSSQVGRHATIELSLRRDIRHFEMEELSMATKNFNEVSFLSSIQHRNLVTLLCYCQENNLQFLIYEYIPNGSVSSHLFASTGA